MKLSELVYQCVKNAVYYDDASFTYEQFLQKRQDGDPDYATNIRNAFGPINEAIMRLGDLEKIPYRVDIVSAVGGVFSKSDLSRDCRSIVAVATEADGEIKPIAFSDLGDSVKVFGVKDGALLVEYKEDIPQFGINSYVYEYIPDGSGGYTISGTPTDVELKDYGIYNSMFPAIIEYAKGNLNEQVAPELANMHLTRAEQYISNLPTIKSSLRQTVVRSDYRIGE